MYTMRSRPCSGRRRGRPSLHRRHIFLGFSLSALSVPPIELNTSFDNAVATSTASSTECTVTCSTSSPMVSRSHLCHLTLFQILVN